MAHKWQDIRKQLTPEAEQPIAQGVKDADAVMLHRAEFAEEYRQQSHLASEADKDDHTTRQIMNDAIASIDGWTA